MYLKDLDEPLPGQGGPPATEEIIMTSRLTFKGRNLFERRQNVNRVVSDEEALCFKKKNVQPHWTVFYQVMRHLLELRPKKRKQASERHEEW